MIANLAAFLAMVSHSEGTDRAADPYRCCYSFRHTIVDFSFHPAEHRPDGSQEWAGELLTDEQCRRAGVPTGCRSTAAGRYQITRPTWMGLKAVLRLPDFGPSSQDEACVQLIRERGALELVSAGRLAEAIAACRSEWASLPGNAAGQPQKTYAALAQIYLEKGGSFA